MNRSRVSAIVRKDLREILANRMVVLPMVIVPLALCVILPAVLAFGSLKWDIAAVNGAAMIEKILPAYRIPPEFTSSATRIAYVFLNYMFVPFFMLVPIMMSGVISANSVVGEKERKTLETLLYTPVTNREFIVAKQLSAFLPAVVVSLASFVCYFVVVNGISLSVAGIWLVRSPLWIPAILLVSPAVSLLALSVTLMLSMRAKTFMEAQQTSAIVVIPFIGLVGAQIGGLLVLSTLSVVLFGLGLVALDLFLLRQVAPKFEREAILRTL